MKRSLRRDPLSGSMVLLAPDAPPRAVRPGAPPDVPEDECPFCPGFEGVTPSTIAAVHVGGAWSARCFAHRTPLLRLEEPKVGRAHGPWDAYGAFGAHEILVESPEHNGPLHVQDGIRAEAAMRLARDRVRDLQRDERLTSFAWWRDIGAAAGALQPHPHAQLLAAADAPPLHGTMRARCAQHMAARGRPLLQDILDETRDTGDRVIRDDGGVLAFAPYAPREAWEVWLVPDAHQHSFGQADDALVATLARVQIAVLRALDAALRAPAVRVTLIGFDARAGVEGCRWMSIVRPLLERSTGLADSTGLSVVGVSPEESAAALRRHICV